MGMGCKLCSLARTRTHKLPADNVIELYGKEYFYHI